MKWKLNKSSGEQQDSFSRYNSFFIAGISSGKKDKHENRYLLLPAG